MEVSTLENVSFGRCLFCATMDVTAQHCSQQFRDGLEEFFFFHSILWDMHGYVGFLRSVLYVVPFLGCTVSEKLKMEPQNRISNRISCYR